MIHLSQRELEDIRRRLHDPDWRRKLQRVQDILQREFEKFKNQTETLTIRTILARSGIKEFESVVKKILANRSRGIAAYSLDDVDDLIGIKILCPYTTDVQAVIHWMKAQSAFRITPENDQEARRQKLHGYRGYHFAIELTGPLLEGHEDLMNLKCEVQIKTMLEEAWDAKTHDVSYKREEEIHPDLLTQMKLLSDALEVLDRQSEIVKAQIQQRQLEERKRKETVVAIHLGEVLKLLEEIVREYSLPHELLEEKFEEASVRKLLPAIENYRRAGRISSQLCYLGALVAMYVRGQQLDAMALAICDELIAREPDNPRPYFTKGQVCWALDLLDEAIEITQTGIGKAGAVGAEQLQAKGKGDLAYWVAEKAWSKTGVLPELIARAAQYIDEAIEQMPEDLAFQDTKGFLLIATGGDAVQIEQGRTLIKKVSDKAEGTRLEKRARSFYERHERIALMRLLETMTKERAT